MTRNAVGAGCALTWRTKCAAGTPNYTVVILTRQAGAQLWSLRTPFHLIERKTA